MSNKEKGGFLDRPLSASLVLCETSLAGIEFNNVR